MKQCDQVGDDYFLDEYDDDDDDNSEEKEEEEEGNGRKKYNGSVMNIWTN